MTTPLARSTRSSFAAALRVAGEAGVYSHKGVTRSTRFVVSAPTAEGIRAESDTSIDAKQFDLLAPFDGLGTGDEFLEPEKGGRVTLDNGRAFVVSKGPTGSVWRWSDGQQTFIRIHTRETT